MIRLVLFLSVLAAPLLSQSHKSQAILFGQVSTVGDNWQIQTMEIGYARRPPCGLAAISVSARLGQFVNESTIQGGTRGFVFVGTLAGRTRMHQLAEFGTEGHVTGIGLDLTVELSRYLSSHSPLPLGSRWTAYAILGSLSVGSGEGVHVGISVGPTFFGSLRNARGLLALRGEIPL